MSDPTTYPYATHLNVKYPALARVDVPALVNACTDRWYNQTLCKVNDSVVRLGVMQGEYHWHKHDDDEFFFGRHPPDRRPLTMRNRRPRPATATLALLLLAASTSAAGAAATPPDSAAAQRIQALVEKAAALVERRGRDALAEFRKPDSEWWSGETYLFAYDRDLNVLLNPAFPQREGSNPRGEKDANGKPFHDEFLRVVQADGAGWVDYRFPRPGQSAAAQKWSYVKAVDFDGTPGILGAGFYAEADAAASPGAPSAASADAQRLLELHQAGLTAHLDGDVEALLAGQADDFVLVNRGEVASLSKAERREFLGPYLANTKFEVYRDAAPPIVRISSDGSLGWVIATVEARGSSPKADGTPAVLAFRSAWIELYERRGGEWLAIGNVSSFAE